MAKGVLDTADSGVTSILLFKSHLILCSADQDCAKCTYHVQIHSTWSLLWCFDRDGKVSIEEVIAAANYLKVLKRHNGD
jgi:Mg2+/Co2+ transporter CorC